MSGGYVNILKDGSERCWPGSSRCPTHGLWQPGKKELGLPVLGAFAKIEKHWDHDGAVDGVVPQEACHELSLPLTDCGKLL